MKKALEKRPEAARLLPARRIAVLSFVDPSVHKSHYGQLSDGFVHVIHAPSPEMSENAIQALINSTRMLGTMRWYVVRPREDGVESVFASLPGPQEQAVVETVIEGRLGWHETGAFSHLLTLPRAYVAEEALVADVQHMRAHAKVPKDIPIFGYVYDAAADRFLEVAEAASVPVAAAAAGGGQKRRRRRAAAV